MGGLRDPRLLMAFSHSSLMDGDTETQRGQATKLRPSGQSAVEPGLKQEESDSKISSGLAHGNRKIGNKEIPGGKGPFIPNSESHWSQTGTEMFPGL